jgi:hypothetical protein
MTRAYVGEHTPLFVITVRDTQRIAITTPTKGE